MSSRRLAILAMALAAAAGGTPGAPAAPRLPAMDAIDPVRHDLAEAIVERVMVPARDGLTVLAVDVIRPRTSQRVPAILFQSPYYNTLGRGYLAERKEHWGTALPAAGDGPRVPFPEWYDEYFVPRGYAVVMQDQRGTRNSSGCQVYGGREEITDAVDVIEWIAAQSWSNGAVGMTGGSYDGTIAIGAASMAPEPLKAIIPIRAIGRWYDYHFFNGVQSSQHLATPWSFTTLTPPTDNASSLAEDDLFPLHVIERRACAASIGALVSAQYSAPYQDARSEFWASRDFLKDAAAITAATFIIHGLNDTNVKTTNAGQLWEALPAGVPKKIWWLRGGHDDPANPDLRFNGTSIAVVDRFTEWTHRWFARYLKGLPSGVELAPVASVQGEDGSWSESLDWPPPGQGMQLFLGQDSFRAGPAQGTVTLSDAAGGGLVIEDVAFAEPARLVDRPFVHLSYSLAAGGDTTFAVSLSDALGQEIAYGYARGAYRGDIRARRPSWPTTPEPHRPGERSRIFIPLTYTDTVVAAGSPLILRITSDDGRVQGGGTGGQVTIHLDGSWLVMKRGLDRAAEHARACATRACS